MQLFKDSLGIAHHVSWSHSSFIPFLSILYPYHSPKQNKTSQNLKEEKREKNSLWILYCEQWVTQSFSLYIFTCKCSLNWVVGMVLSLCFLLHHQYWDIAGSLLGYSVAILYYGYPITLGPRSDPSHVPTLCGIPIYVLWIPLVKEKTALACW